MFADDQNSNNDTSAADKDPNVYSFLMQLVQEKHGDEIDAQFLQEEADRLYDIFGDLLLTYFEPQLDDQQRAQFDEMVNMNSDQDDLLGFLTENINDLEEQIVALLVKFRQDYISGNMEDQGGEELGNNN
jgi:hypothetical protein